MVRELANHPGMTLRDDAAIQLDLLEKDHGVITINRAGVSEAEQQKLIDRWNQGGKYNRPPFLYEPKQPARDSDHVQKIAVDTSSITHMLKYGDAYGFYRNYEWDKPHFVFDPKRVRIRPQPANVPIKELENGDMEAFVVAPNNTVVHLRNGGKTNMNDAAQYNKWRDQVMFLRSVNATDMLEPPLLGNVPKVDWDTFNFMCDWFGAPRK